LAVSNTTNPEWLREKQVTAQFALSHTILYALRLAGEIRSVSLKLPGNKYGARLFNVASVREFIARQEASIMGVKHE
jgi:hypothetical protein